VPLDKRFREMLSNVARCALDGRTHPIPLDEILHGVFVFEAAVESARSGQPVLVKS
jgi:predicted dehydrogenase